MGKKSSKIMLFQTLPWLNILSQSTFECTVFQQYDGGDRELILIFLAIKSVNSEKEDTY